MSHSEKETQHRDAHDAGHVSRRGFLKGVGGTVGAAALSPLAAERAEAQPSPTQPVLRNGVRQYAAEGSTITLKVNGQPHELTIHPSMTLLEAVRENLDLTGSKEVCDRACGACTMLIDGKAINSCLTLAIDAVGHEITTIEGLAHDQQLDPVQQAFIDHDACQCGYCIPGFVVRSRALLDETPDPNLQQIKEGLSGNICRCAAYIRIFEAVSTAPRRRVMSWRKDNRVALENDGVRVDIREKVTGKARYTTDYYPDNMLWAGYIRCPYGNATVREADVEKARKIAGVLEVEMTREKGRYPGDRIGHVCAESRMALEDALAALQLQFDIDSPKTSLDRVKTPLDQVAPPDNADEVAKALDGAPHVLERTYETQVQTHCSLEPHIALVDYRGDHAIAWGSTQGTFGFRDDLTTPLGLPQDKVEFHCEYIGGGFGSKFGMDAQGLLAAKMSKKYNRPCRCSSTRKEEMIDTGMRPGSIQSMKVGVGDDGKIQAARIHTWGSVGFEGGGGGVRNPSRYDYGVAGKTHEDVHLNSQTPRPMRSPGHPQALFAIEVMNDELAAKLGMNPLEFRLKNDPNEVRREMLKAGAEMIGWDRWQPNGSGRGPIKTGLGIGVADWGNRPGDATVAVNVYRDGRIQVLCGSQDIGMGFRTLVGDCVISHLGLPRQWLDADVGASIYPPGPASGGSRTSRQVAPKAFMAADQARRAMLKTVAREWNVDPEQVEFFGGEFTHNGQTMNWPQACKLITSDHLSFSASEDGPYWKDPTESEAVQFAEVEVDVETGIVRVKKVVAIQEVGLPVNRHTIENQITGAVIQGISFCLFENRILNRQTGAQVNPNMEMAKIAGPQDVPEIIPIIWKAREDPGVNSLGEPPVIPPPGAIGCAVANAIGAWVRTMPITPARVLAALEEAKGARA